MATQNDMWEFEPDDESALEATGGDLVNAWDCEAGWVQDVHLKSLDELAKVGYPDVHIGPNSKEIGSGEKPLGNTGLDVTPYGLVEVWRDLGETWGMSTAKIQRITVCHGICIFAKDSYFTEMNKLYRMTTRLMRGSTNSKLFDELENSALAYEYNPKRAKKGGSLAYLTNRLGIVSKIQHTLGIAQTQTFIELSVASIMTLEGSELSKWKKTLAEEHKAFKEHEAKRMAALENLNLKLSK